MRWADLIVGYFQADLPLREIEPFRQAGSDAYDLIETISEPGWARLAAWNAYFLQVYGDDLVAAGSNSRYVRPDIASFARVCYGQACVWLEEAHKARASPAYSFRYPLPHNLPHWSEPIRTDHQLAGMRAALDTGHTRVASDFQSVAAGTDHYELLRVRVTDVNSKYEYIEHLWARKPALELRATLGDHLTQALDDVYGVGHLLAQPALLQQLS